MSYTQFPAVKVGDKLVLVTGNRYRGDEPVTVARVGRKYLYVTLHGHEYRTRFHRDTGTEDAKYSTRERLYTPEQYEEMNQRNSLFKQLREVGIDFRSSVSGSLTTGQLRDLLAVMRPDA